MDPVAFYIFSKPIYWYGIIIATALIVGVVLGILEAKRRGYRSEMIFDFLLLAIPICIVCARLYYVIFEWSSYAAHPWKIIAIWQGGLAIYGAVIGGVIAAIIFFKWRKIHIGEILDIAAPSIIIGQAIGRWGNFVNQEAFGQRIYDSAWKWFPAAIKITVEDGSIEWHQATFFYESMWNLLVFAALMIMRKKVKIRGGIFAWYVVLYGFGRFWIEGLRTDSLYWGNTDIRVSQVLSLILFLGGIAYLIIQKRKAKETLAYDGFYSLSWSEEQIEEYRVHAKMYRAKENAECTAQKVKDYKAAKTAALKAMIEKAKEKAIKDAEAEKKKAEDSGEDKTEVKKVSAKEIEKEVKDSQGYKDLKDKWDEKIEKAKEKEKETKEKAEKITEETKLADEKAEQKRKEKEEKKSKEKDSEEDLEEEQDNKEE